LGSPSDPLLRTVNPATNLPYEWQFGVAGVERALELSPGSPAIVVGVRLGRGEIPDLAGKIDGQWSFVNGWHRWRASATAAAMAPPSRR
jgi:hypothetical protein